MSTLPERGTPQRDALRKLSTDADYSAQTYYEASKAIEFWSRMLVFVPATVGTFTSLVTALGGGIAWGAVGAIAGAVAATASFLGSTHRSESVKESARRFTAIRHGARLELDLAESVDEATLEARIRELRKDYLDVVSTTEPVSTRFYKRASERISAGVLDYSAVDEVTASDI